MRIKILAVNFTFQVTALAYVLLCPEAVDAGQVSFNFSIFTKFEIPPLFITEIVTLCTNSSIRLHLYDLYV